MLVIDTRLSLPLSEIEVVAIRAQGAGGQNIHKTASAVHLRFDVLRSSLPDEVKQRLLARADRRLSKDGVVVIKAQQFRSLDQNRDAALERLAELIRGAARVPRVRKATKPTLASKRRRVDDKTRRGRIKTLRGSVDD
ncbi:alternative ribosome rescue aminoacyl-tRNA hydrolase ArfB [Sinimarinibacterium flocculans]|uniref:Ribosome-associated protein n=1 Tax=Sinimarinibacterium flocculans TaxID=985250 RepID=A0A318ECZ0_9GAMM|nr:alternative ribosome rescue aminoacyl-tRNA hydrolase ArfB [Sinimarinibacterium flocculans]PXV69474.1 ribosome-associated protein [Sinimarinibacterium flocculans]